MAQELKFIEAQPDRWFYIIEQPSAPKDAWDWMEYADAFGPFPTLIAAQEHEYASHSDTTGAEIIEFSQANLSAGTQRLIASAQAS